MEWDKIESSYKILVFSRTPWRILLRISLIKDKTLLIVIVKKNFISIDQFLKYNPKQNGCIFIGSQCISPIFLASLFPIRQQKILLGSLPLAPPPPVTPLCSSVLSLKCLSYLSIPFVHEGVGSTWTQQFLGTFHVWISLQNLHHICIHLATIILQKQHLKKFQFKMEAEKRIFVSRK